MYSANEIKKDSTLLNRWEKVVFADFDATINNKDRPFPCLFGVNGYRKDMLRFSFYDQITASSLKEDLVIFCKNYRSYGKQTSFVVFEKPSTVMSIEYYREKFWNILKDLAGLDNIDWPQDIPKQLDHPEWEFCFNGEPMFIVCNTPAHVNRMSRRSPGFMLTIQPRWVFNDLLDTEIKANNAFSTVTKRLLPFDSVDKSPYLGKYGDPYNREWTQYFLDDGQDIKMSCPFHTMEEKQHELISKLDE